MTALLLYAFVVAWMVAACTAASILSERWTSLEDRCVGHSLTRASTMATALQETALAPLCRLPGQCWMLKEYLRHFSFSLKRHGLCTLLRSLTKYSGQWLMIGYYYHLWASHDEYSALLKCPGDCSCFAFNRCILALCVSAESAICKYNAPFIGTTHWRFFGGARAVLLQQ